MVSYTLAQFPLAMVVFPGETVPLHIFEPRYRDLVNDCRGLNMPFGIVPVIDQQVMKIGTKVVLEKIKKHHSDGRMDISVRAISTYQLLDFQEKGSKAYPEGLVQDLELAPPHDSKLEDVLLALIEELYTVMQIKQPVELDNFYRLIHKLSFTLEEEYNLISMKAVDEQRQYMRSRLENLIPQIREVEEVRRRISMNGQYQHDLS